MAEWQSSTIWTMMKPGIIGERVLTDECIQMDAMMMENQIWGFAMKEERKLYMHCQLEYQTLNSTQKDKLIQLNRVVRHT